MTTDPAQAGDAPARDAPARDTPATGDDGDPPCRGGRVSDTQLIHGGVDRTRYNEVSEAIHLTSAYVYPSAEAAEAATQRDGADLVYSRFRNPTVIAFEERLRRIEGAEACQATASGMAAVTAVLLSCLSSGDRIIMPHAVFGACNWMCAHLLPRFGVTVERVEGTDPGAWAAALATPAKLVFLETPANPTLELIDLSEVAALTRRAGALLVVDNALASPLCQKPLALGADVVVYSTTKHIDGEGRCLGGAILGREAFIRDTVQPFVRSTGPTLSPFNAWVMLKGMETLGLRVRHAAASAASLATSLEGHAKVDRVLYPALPSHPQYQLARRQMTGGGTLLAVEVAGGRAGAFRFLNALQLVLRVNNLGDTRTLATHPSTTTHSKLTAAEKRAAGVTEGLVRISVGLEEVDDLLGDIRMPSPPREAGVAGPGALRAGDATRIAHAGQRPQDYHGAVNVPVYHASSIGFPTVAAYEAAEAKRFECVFYGRYGSPTSFALEEAVAELEGGYRAIAVPSGVAAISLSLLALAGPGDHLLVADCAYGPTRSFCEGKLRELGVETTWFDPALGAGIAALIRPNTRAVFLESPGSGTFEIQDVPAIAGAAAGPGVPVLIDNTWATPCFFKPFEKGVAVSIHSATKYIGGHSDLMMGLIVTDRAHYERIRRTTAHFGQCVGPDDCYLALRGLRSLAARLAMHQAHALRVASWLQTREEVAAVLYPALPAAPGHDLWRRDFLGASSLFAIELARQVPQAAAYRFIEALRHFCLGASWGGYESMVMPVQAERACSSWKDRGPLVRLHVGLEDPDDLIADLAQGLDILKMKGALNSE